MMGIITPTMVVTTAPEGPPLPNKGHPGPTGLLAQVALMRAEYETEVKAMWTVVETTITAIEESLNQFKKGPGKKVGTPSQSQHAGVH